LLYLLIIVKLGTLQIAYMINNYSLSF